MTRENRRVSIAMLKIAWLCLFKREVNLISDTSGSMSGNRSKIYLRKLVKLLLYVTNINYVQCDTKVLSEDRITNLQEFDNIKPQGYRGTRLQVALRHLKNTNRRTIIFTDYDDDFKTKLPLSVFELNRFR